MTESRIPAGRSLRVSSLMNKLILVARAHTCHKHLTKMAMLQGFMESTIAWKNMKFHMSAY